VSRYSNHSQVTTTVAIQPEPGEVFVVHRWYNGHEVLDEGVDYVAVVTTLGDSIDTLLVNVASHKVGKSRGGLYTWRPAHDYEHFIEEGTSPEVVEFLKQHVPTAFLTVPV
jgi:hypothetical protein